MSEAHKRCVLGDWGVSRLRLTLMDRGEIAGSRTGPGVGALTASPAETLAQLVAPWIHAGRSLDVVLCGMAGSRNGLLETAYATTPIEAGNWARVARRMRAPDMEITIAAGLLDAGCGEASDVMRGEETQVFGALKLDATLRTGSHLLVLPGSHSKWVEIENGLIVRFQTAVTGELFALLRDHSMLLRTGPTGEQGNEQDDADAGFAVGVRRAADVAAPLLSALFETRTAQLLQQRSRAWASGFLSGLLIGAEIASFSALRPSMRRIVVIGDAQLAARYRRTFAERGVEARILDGDACAIAGLRDLHARTHGGEA